MGTKMFDRNTFPILSFSWVIHSPFFFTKKMDRSAFVHHGTGIPRELRSFFDISDIKFKEKRKVIVKYRNNVFSGFIECDNRDRTRLMWYSEFSAVINRELKNWSLYFRNNKNCNEICPLMQLVKEKRNIYNVQFIDYAFNWVNGQPLTIREKEIEQLDIEDFFKKNIYKKIDYIEKAKRNCLLGFLGEQFIFEHEKKSLIEANRTSLSDRVEHVSVTRGDGCGFDILSFKPDGNPKFIEVKTSEKQNTDFFITNNELNCSRDYSVYYYLYRLNNFDWINKIGNVQITQGNLYSVLKLEAMVYKGRLL